MANNNKVVKFRRPINLNLGVLIFGVMFIYVMIELFQYFSSEQVSVYEVTESQIADDNTYQGLAIREEHIVNTEEAGYVSYYVNEGKKVANKMNVYSIDQRGDIYDLLSKNEQQGSLDAADILEIRECISSYRSSYSGSDYGSVYDYKSKIESSAMSLNNMNLMGSLSKILKSNDVSKTFKLVQAKNSGSIAFYKDGLEGVTVDNFTEDMFNPSNFKKQELQTKDKVEANAPVYKLITNENWNIVIPLSDSQARNLAGKSVVKVTFLQDRLYTNALFKIVERDGKQYGIISLRNYIQQYLSYRYLKISISTDTITGYKVPKSAVTERDYYKVPLEYFTKGGDSNNTGLVKMSYDKSGKQQVNFVATEVTYKDEKDAYIDVSYFEKGDILCMESDNTKQFTIGDTSELQGVFNVNKGYPTFRLINVLTENDDYYIVERKTENGLNNYDHIILNVALAKKQKYVD